MSRVIKHSLLFALCLMITPLVYRFCSGSFEESLIVKRMILHFKQYKYQYVHEEFRRHYQTIHKFVTNDTSFPFTNYVMKQNMVWDHSSVCSNDTFVLLLYFVSQKDFERRQVLREYVKQNMTVDGKQINYMIVVATDDKAVINGLEKENELYHDMLVSVHADTFANLTYTTLDSFMWVRDYCRTTQFVSKVDGDAWTHFGNLVHYLKSVPSTSFYGGYPCSRVFRRGFRYKGVQMVPKDYMERRWYYVAGGAYILSADLVPFINIGTEYIDVILTAEDAVIGDIVGLIGVRPYKKSKDYIVYSNLNWHKDGIVPPNAIFIN